jgi:hypothetical protein
MTLNKLGTFVYLFTNEWQEYCKENGIEDPFKKRQKIIGSTFYLSTTDLLGQEFPCVRQRELTSEEAAMLPSDEECEAFRIEAFNFVAERLIKEVSWDEFEAYIKMNKREDLLDRFFPCDAQDGQCNLFCKKQGGCGK